MVKAPIGSCPSGQLEHPRLGAGSTVDTSRLVARHAMGVSPNPLSGANQNVRDNRSHRLSGHEQLFVGWLADGLGFDTCSFRLVKEICESDR